MFDKIALIGIGLIGGSIARDARKRGLAKHYRRRDAQRRDCGQGQRAEARRSLRHRSRRGGEGRRPRHRLHAGRRLRGGDARRSPPSLKPGCIISDVGSVKQAVIADMKPHIPAGVHFVPAHPVAGTEYSGPEAAILDLFQGRGCILTPLPGVDAAAADKLEAFWRALGSDVNRMDPAHHDRILAITSHLPHLIAYTIVGTADDLGGHLNSEVLKYAAGGFRDFTRIAASDPTMWRDVFLNNKRSRARGAAALPGRPVLPAARDPLGRGRQAVRPVHPHPRDPPRADPSPPGSEVRSLSGSSPTAR